MEFIRSISDGTLTALSRHVKSIYMDDLNDSMENRPLNGYLFGEQFDWGPVILEMFNNKIEKMKISCGTFLSRQNSDFLREVSLTEKL